jgi:hypothetical protein
MRSSICRPVLGLGAAGARLDVEKGVVRIHFAGKHALEFQPLDFLGQPHGVGLDLRGRAAVGFRLRQVPAIPRHRAGRG